MNDKKLTVIIVDDEPMARVHLRKNLESLGVEVVAEAENAAIALQMVEEHSPDFVTLDIQMPGLNGIQFLQSLKTPLLSILITAYEKYALEGYSLDVVDYLLKPVSFDRFLKAATKANEIFQLRTKSQLVKKTMDFIFVQADYNLVKINLGDVSHIEGLKDYVKIHLMGSPRPVIT